MFGEEFAAMAAAAKAKAALLERNGTGYFLASMLAGAYVGFGILLIFTAGGALGGAPWAKIVMGVSFGIALSLVVIAGAELFTGNNMVMTAGLTRNTVTLTTRKTRTGTIKRDEMPMNTEVRSTMLWLWENRQGTSNHVFTCPVEPFIGQPYKSAAHVMKRLCARAGVKRFGFHAIRHLAATILAQEGHSLFSIQHSLRHEKQSTTDRYLHGLGAFKEVATALDSLAGRGPAKVLPFPSLPSQLADVIVRRRAG